MVNDRLNRDQHGRSQMGLWNDDPNEIRLC